MSTPSVEPPPKPSDDNSLYNPSRKKLFNEAMNRNWEKVKNLYRNEKVQGVYITCAKDTLLHVAVSSAPEETVLELLDIVKPNKDMSKILNVKNKTGDTPLHLAAAIGLEKVCRKIAKLCPDMVTSARNNLQETPLFSAVHHGNKYAFFELELAIHMNQKLEIDKNCLEKRDITHCRGDDGNNILHYAIKWEQFDLAYEIIHLYPVLVNYVNSSGETALHTLANKPFVFKSGARFGLYDKIIYHCTIIEPLEYDFVNFMKKETTGRNYDQADILQEDENKVMPIYKVCIDLYSLMKDSISWTFNTNACCLKIGTYKAWCTDVENPSSSTKTASSPKTGKAPSSGEEGLYQSPSIVQENQSSSSEPVAASSSEPVAASSSKPIVASSSKTDKTPSSAKAQKEQKRMYPKNHDTMILFFKTILNLLLVVLGIGISHRFGRLVAYATDVMVAGLHSINYNFPVHGQRKKERRLTRLQTIRKIKQQHRNAKKIMKELVYHSKLWEYEEASGGKKPDDDDESPSVISGATYIGYQWMTPVEDRANPVLVAAKKIMNVLVNQLTLWKYKEASGGKEPDDDDESLTVINGATHIDSKQPPGRTPIEDQASPVLLAAKSGIIEMVKKILKKYPVAVMDKDKDNKNIILLAVEFRQVHVYMYMLENFSTMESVFQQVDKDQNSALHLAAMLSHSRPWSNPGAALQMQWESKWYQYVHSSSSKMNEELFSINKKGKKPEELFIETHVPLVEDGRRWLTNISQSCSGLAAIVATVVFASAITVPGGVDQQSGFPILGTSPVFQLFAISSLVALCFSVTSIVMFFTILTSGYEVREFNRSIPVKLILGLTTLFMSFASMLVSFCAGNFFIVENKLKFAVYPIYAVMCFMVTFFAVMYFPLIFFVIKATIKKAPEVTEKMHVD